MFRDKGFAASTVRDIAAAVGMEAASLYNHIQSKHEILHDICFAIANMYTEKIEELLNETGSPLVKIKRLVHLHIDTNLMETPLARVTNDEWIHMSEEDREKYARMKREYEDNFIELIQEGMDLEQIKSRDATVVFFTILSMIRWTQNWQGTAHEMNVEVIKDNVTKMVFDSFVQPDLL